MEDFNTENHNEDVIVEVPVSYTYDNNAKKKKSAGFGLKSLIAVAAICSILGGAIGSSLMLLLPKNTSPYVYNGSNTGNSKTAAGSDMQLATGNFDNLFKSADSSTSGSFLNTVAKGVSPSVVGIKATPPTSSNQFSFIIGNSSGPSEGSGIIINPNGYIVTNSHVIASAIDSNGKLANGAKVEVYLANALDTPYAAEVVGWDRKTDLAVIKINLSNLPAITFADSSQVVVGDMAIAIGNPGGLDYMGSVTMGIVSGLNRTVSTEDGRSLTYIQTDAAINPGNSGGALVNSKGELIGINTIKIAGEGYEGLGFAIPSNVVKEIAGNLIQYQYVPGRAFLGISVETRYTAAYAQRYNLPEGVYILEVEPLSGAYNAGIQPQDIITKIEGKSVKTLAELSAEVAKYKPGDVVTIDVYRSSDSKNMTFEVTLGEDKS